jgi:acyl-CoA thioesterase
MTQLIPGMITSILPFEAVHKHERPVFRQNLYIYSTIKDDAPGSDDPHLNAAAHCFHSDRESVWSCIRQYDLLPVLDSAASLSHTVIFHTGLDKIRFHTNNGRRWFYLETGSKRVSDGRLLHKGKIYDAEGNHLMTTMQDGAIRLNWDEDEKNQAQEKIMRDSKL